MKHIRVLAFHLALMTVLVFLLLAAATSDQTMAAEDKDFTEIIVDKEADTVRIVIEGREIVTIDAGGLHVDGDLNFTGRLKDVGVSRTAAPERPGEPVEAER